MGLTEPRILIVDDQLHDLELATLLLEREFDSAQLQQVADAVTFATALGAEPFDLVISERRPAWAEGAGVIAALRRCFPRAALILFSREADPADDLAATRLGLDYALQKSSSGFLQLPLVAQRLLGRGADAPEASATASLIQRLPVGLLRVDPQGHRLITLNGACRRLLRLEGVPEGSEPSLPELLAPGVERESLDRALESGEPVTGLDIPLRAAAGPQAWLRISLWPAEPGTGKGCEGMLWDAGESRRELQRLSSESERLVRSNKDLERFAYVVSHDLQQPLGYISRYANLLADGYLAQLDNDAQRYLTRIVEASERLQQMVDDVLAYSRLSSRGGAFAMVDFSDLADAAVAELETRFAETNGTCRREALPRLRADAAQIQQLFTNLFSNALKFHGEDPPRIRVSATQDGDYWRFCVADNGIGMRPEDRERVFEMFQRLHGEDEYPGTGIGLAICRGIVERHGGSIWAESAPGQGSRFWFTIPTTPTEQTGAEP